MFTNRDEVLEKALRIFAKMNYEKASQMEIARTCGLSKAGLTYYFPFKQDLFTAVADRYVFDTQHSKNKFNFTAGSLSEFIDRYVAGVEKHDAAARAPAGRREQSQRVQLQLLLLPPADAGKAVLSQRGEKDSRHIRAELTALEIRHREGEGKRGNQAGCGCG